MALEDKDFILKEIKQTVRNMGKILGLESVKDLLAMDSMMQDVEPAEIETVYYVEFIHDEQMRSGLTDALMAEQIGISDQAWQELYQSQRSATSEELVKLADYFNQYI